MAEKVFSGERKEWRLALLVGCVALLAAFTVTWPHHALDVTVFVFWGLLTVAPIVIPGIIVAAWIVASGANSRVAGAFKGKNVANGIARIVDWCNHTCLWRDSFTDDGRSVGSRSSIGSDNGILALFTNYRPCHAGRDCRYIGDVICNRKKPLPHLAWVFLEEL